MKKKLTVYFNTPQGSVRVAEVSLNQDGGAVVTILDTPHAEAVKRLLGEIGSYRLHRMVKPSDGESYLDAIREMFVRSTYWYALDKS